MPAYILSAAGAGFVNLNDGYVVDVSQLYVVMEEEKISLFSINGETLIPKSLYSDIDGYASWADLLAFVSATFPYYATYSPSLLPQAESKLFLLDTTDGTEHTISTLDRKLLFDGVEVVGTGGVGVGASFQDILRTTSIGI